MGSFPAERHPHKTLRSKPEGLVPWSRQHMYMVPAEAVRQMRFRGHLGDALEYGTEATAAHRVVYDILAGCLVADCSRN